MQNTYYSYSNFKKEIYYRDFFDVLNKARSTGNKDVCINTVMKLNNYLLALKLKGDIKIQEIFDDNWKIFYKSIIRITLKLQSLLMVKKWRNIKNLNLVCLITNAKTAEIFILLSTLAKVHFVQLAVKKDAIKLQQMFQGKL